MKVVSEVTLVCLAVREKEAHRCPEALGFLEKKDLKEKGVFLVLEATLVIKALLVHLVPLISQVLMETLDFQD